MSVETPQPLAEAWSLLDKTVRLFAIHAPSFPWSTGEDLAVGTPYSEAATQLLHRIRSDGFNGVLLGPLGRTTAFNPSPYDGTAFSRSELLLAPSRLVEDGWLDKDLQVSLHDEAHDAAEEGRVDYGLAHRLIRRLVDGIPWSLDRTPEFRRFVRENQDWLESDGLYEALCLEHGAATSEGWPGSDRAEALWSLGGAPRRLQLHAHHGDLLRRLERQQFLVDQQHRAFKQQMATLELEVWGDLQIGLSLADVWRLRGLFIDGYAMGAPPSRTNPEGQAWGYPVWNPEREEDVRAWMHRRLRWMGEQFDGIRVDHPHGWVCPWVYRRSEDPLPAVQQGARMFESPDLSDHAELSRWARVRPEQLQRNLPRHDDDWVEDLTADQTEEYRRWLEDIVRAFPAGRSASEVLSTQPRPLAEVHRRLKLGRFRVTQKADPNRSDDVYRAETARPEDWVMVGTHDTASIWDQARSWLGTPRATDEAHGLAAQLGCSVDAVLQDSHALARAKISQALASPARNLMMFFSDRFGIEERYNVPGTVAPSNWSLRLSHPAPDGFDVGAALVDALAMRFADPPAQVTRCARSLRSLAGAAPLSSLGR